MDHFIRVHGLLLELSEITCVLPLSQSVARSYDTLTCQPALVQLNNLSSGAREKRDMGRWLVNYNASIFYYNELKDITLNLQLYINNIINDLNILLNASKKHIFMEQALASADSPPKPETLKFIDRT